MARPCLYDIFRLTERDDGLDKNLPVQLFFKENIQTYYLRMVYVVFMFRPYVFFYSIFQFFLSAKVIEQNLIIYLIQFNFMWIKSYLISCLYFEIYNGMFVKWKSFPFISPEDEIKNLIKGMNCNKRVK